MYLLYDEDSKLSLFHKQIKTSPVCVPHTTCEEISIKTHLSVTGYAAVDKPRISIDDPFQPPRGYLL